MPKILKLADLIAQALITSCCFLLAIINNTEEPLFWWYFILGGWQVASFIIHSLFNPGWKNTKQRKNYITALAWLTVLGLICYLLLLLELPIIIFYLFALLVIGPAMAVWYYIICANEWINIRHREFIHLK